MHYALLCRHPAFAGHPFLYEVVLPDEAATNPDLIVVAASFVEADMGKSGMRLGEHTWWIEERTVA